MNRSLFEGEMVRLSPLDAERDADTIARWTLDSGYLHQISMQPACPLSPAQVRKQLQEKAKPPDGFNRAFEPAIRSKDADRLVGLARLERIQWTHGTGWLTISIGDPADRNRGYGGDALGLLLRYAFRELNLHRLTAAVGEDNAGAQRFLQRAGFSVEVRRRQAIYRAGRRWDSLYLGLLREEWEARHE